MGNLILCFYLFHLFYNCFSLFCCLLPELIIFSQLDFIHYYLEVMHSDSILFVVILKITCIINVQSLKLINIFSFLFFFFFFVFLGPHL